MNSATLDPAAGPVPLQQDAAIIGLVGLAHASSHFSHLLLPLLFPVFMTEFGLSYSQLGLLMTVFFVVSGAGQALAGFAMNFIGDYEKATEHFHKALSLCPLCPTWYYLVGAQPHQDTGNLEKAAELLRRGITAEPDSPLCRFYLADVLLEQGN